MNAIVHNTTSKGAVTRTIPFKDGVQVQCTAGHIHFDAWLASKSDDFRMAITQAADPAQEDPGVSLVRFTGSAEYAEALGDYFLALAKAMKRNKQQRPENQLAQANEAARCAEAQVDSLQAELKAVRSHKRKPRLKAVPA